MESGSLSAEEAGKNKVIVILGPTSSGKSDVAIRLAQKFDGEIISADSRQVYKGLDAGTGKISRDFSVPKSKVKSQKSKFKPYFSKGIAHYLIDIASPKTKYNVSKFKKDANRAINYVIKKGKLPIICGGTGFWIKALVDDLDFPQVKPDKELRRILEKECAERLIESLKKMDPERAETIDPKNKVRLIRAIEVCKYLGHVPIMNRESRIMNYEFLQIGIDVPKEKLHENIQKRLKTRFESGMIAEVEKLRASGLSWKKIQSFGLGYYWIPLYLQKKINRKELFEEIYQAEKDYAKRQMTWFRKDNRILWLKNYKDIEKEVKRFLS